MFLKLLALLDVPMYFGVLNKNRFYQFSHSQNEYNVSKEKAK